MSICRLCYNNCGIDREKTPSPCKIGGEMKFARIAPHFHEEPCISGVNGSGAIFFCGCSLSCVFCQNYQVSRNTLGKAITPNELADKIKMLEDMGVHNINFVNPTHFADKIIRTLDIYKPNIPIVYNTHGYDNIETIQMLNGYIDIYLPDLKYKDNQMAKSYSNANNYFENVTKILPVMRNQCNDIYKEVEVVVKGNKEVIQLLQRGMIIRHLILPKGYNDSIDIVNWIGDNMPTTQVSLMSQYTPYGDLSKHPHLNRKLFQGEINKVQQVALDRNIKGYFQEKTSAEEDYIPHFE